MRRLFVLGAVGLALAGCGGSGTTHTAPAAHLPRPLASTWRTQAGGVASALAAGDGCLALQRAQALQKAVIAAVNARRVPARFQEPLLGAVNDLAGRIGCTPPAPAPTPVPSRGHGTPHPPHPPHGNGHGHGHGKGPKR